MLLEGKRSGVTVITLDNPPANAIGAPEIEALSRTLAQAADDRECRALVIRGAGRFFCAGCRHTHDAGRRFRMTMLDYKVINQ